MTSKRKRATSLAEAATRPAAIEAATSILRAALERCPLLMLHDTTLPSATASIAGEPIVGSWWGHAQGAVIFGALEAIEPEITLAKLVRGKVTLIHRALWPALIAVGAAEDPWQLGGLRPEARALLAQVNAAGSARTDRLRESGDGPAIGRAVEQLERRLLVASAQVHTASGKHARELWTWRRWRQHVGLTDSLVPTAAAARERIAEAVAGWPPGEPLLPWPMGA